MFFRSLLLFLIAVPAAFGQTRERGKFSIRDDKVTAMALDAKVKYVLLAFGSGATVVFPADQRIVTLYTFPAHKKGVTAAMFLPDGKQFITAGADGTVKVWDILAARTHHAAMEEKRGETKPPLPTPSLTIAAHQGAIAALAVSPDGHRAVTGGPDGSVKVWGLETGKLIAAVATAHPGGTRAVAFDPAGTVLATAGADKTVRLWSIGEKALELRKMDGHDGPVTSLAFSPDGTHLAAGTGVAKKSGAVNVWEVATGKLAYALTGHEDIVTCVLFHPKEARLASGGADKKVRFWDTEKKKEVAADDHPDALRGLLISGDGTRLGTFSASAARWWEGFGK